MIRGTRPFDPAQDGRSASGNSKKPNLVAYVVCAMLFALCLSVEAQELNKSPRIGLLASAAPPVYTARIAAFDESLRSLGYKDIGIEHRYADGKIRSPPGSRQAVT